jgi:alpha-ketoglutarate-dependent sulfate ester dioxygenase
MSALATAIDVHRVTEHIGAEITGVRVGPDLPPSVVEFIRDALLKHKVLFFRGQHHLDDAAQAGFAKLFGELELTANRRTRPGMDPESRLRDVDSRRTRAEAWHTDATYTDRPPALTILRSVTVPPYGGDTAWANTVTAYESLAPKLRELVDGLRVIHSNDDVIGKRYAARSATGFFDGTKEAPQAPRKRVFATEHPVVSVHPESGERALLLGVFAKSIVGRDDSQALLDMLQAQVTRLGNTLRWRWALGDIGVWDNRATQHTAIHDYGQHPRLMRRVTVAGGVPAGVDGKPSIPLSDSGNSDNGTSEQ